MTSVFQTLNPFSSRLPNTEPQDRKGPTSVSTRPQHPASQSFGATEFADLRYPEQVTIQFELPDFANDKSELGQLLAKYNKSISDRFKADAPTATLEDKQEFASFYASQCIGPAGMPNETTREARALASKYILHCFSGEKLPDSEHHRLVQLCERLRASVVVINNDGSERFLGAAPSKKLSAFAAIKGGIKTKFLAQSAALRESMSQKGARLYGQASAVAKNVIARVQARINITSPEAKKKLLTRGGLAALFVTSILGMRGAQLKTIANEKPEAAGGNSLVQRNGTEARTSNRTAPQQQAQQIKSQVIETASETKGTPTSLAKEGKTQPQSATANPKAPGGESHAEPQPGLLKSRASPNSGSAAALSAIKDKSSFENFELQYAYAEYKQLASEAQRRGFLSNHPAISKGVYNPYGSLGQNHRLFTPYTLGKASTGPNPYPLGSPEHKAFLAGKIQKIVESENLARS